MGSLQAASTATAMASPYTNRNEVHVSLFHQQNLSTPSSLELNAGKSKYRQKRALENLKLVIIEAAIIIFYFVAFLYLSHCWYRISSRNILRTGMILRKLNNRFTTRRPTTRQYSQVSADPQTIKKMRNNIQEQNCISPAKLMMDPRQQIYLFWHFPTNNVAEKQMNTMINGKGRFFLLSSSILFRYFKYSAVIMQLVLVTSDQ